MGEGAGRPTDDPRSTRSPGNTFAPPPVPESVPEPGFLDQATSFLKESGIGTIAGLATAPFIGPLGAALFGGGAGLLSGQERRKDEGRLDLLTPEAEAKLGYPPPEVVTLEPTLSYDPVRRFSSCL